MHIKVTFEAICPTARLLLSHSFRLAVLLHPSIAASTVLVKTAWSSQHSVSPCMFTSKAIKNTWP